MKKRSTRSLAGALLALALIAPLTFTLAQDKDEAKKGKAKKKAVKIDLLAHMKKLNSKEFAAPPTTFRKGHVTPRALDPKAITKLDDGFQIQLPSKAPVPTPTFYKGKIYVSGGFHSREFYCFDGETGALVWGINLDDDGPSAAVVADGICVFNTESCTIFAVDAETGKHLWSYWLGDPLMSTPTIAGGRVFSSYPASGGGQIGQNFQGNGQAKPAPKDPKAKKAPKKRPPASHVLACFDLKTGKILWQRWIDSDVMSAPIAVDEDLFVTTFAGTLIRFRQSDGTILSAEGARATSAPVVVGKDVLVTRRADEKKSGKVEESLVAIDRDSGKRNFEAQRKKADYLDARVQEKSRLAAKGKKLDAGNGFGAGPPASSNWKRAAENIGQGRVSTLQAFQGSRGLVLGGFNFNCMGNELVCTDRSSGKSLWKLELKGDMKKLGGFLAAPPSAAGGQVFLATLKGEVLQMDPKTGKQVRKFEMGAPLRFQPAIMNGRIYVGTQDGKIVCRDTGDKTLTGWSMWGGDAGHSGARHLKKASK